MTETNLAGADGTSAALTLIAARRSGMDSKDFGALVSKTMLGLTEAHPGDITAPLTWLVGQLAAMASHAMNQWDQAADGTPSADFLGQVGGHVAEKRG